MWARHSRTSRRNGYRNRSICLVWPDLKVKRFISFKQQIADMSCMFGIACVKDHMFASFNLQIADRNCMFGMASVKQTYFCNILVAFLGLVW